MIAAPARFCLPILAGLALVACSPANEPPTSPSADISDAVAPRDAEESPPVLVRRSERLDTALQALAMGRLNLDADGCLRIGDDTGPFVIWHHDSTIDRAPDGRWRVTDGYTGNSAFVGDEIAMGGAQGHAPFPDTIPPIPDSCANYALWMGGQLMSEQERQDMLARQRDRAPVPSPQ